jgi:hypothetical protein
MTSEPKRRFYLHIGLLIVAAALLIASEFMATTRTVWLLDAARILNAARSEYQLVGLERQSLLKSSKKILEDRRKLNRDVIAFANRADATMATNQVEGTFTVLAYMDTNGLPRNAVQIEGRSYINLPYPAPLMLYSPSEWSVLTNLLSGLLVTGTNAATTSTVFTERK